jgi:hypothetical protein
MIKPKTKVQRPRYFSEYDDCLDDGGVYECPTLWGLLYRLKIGGAAFPRKNGGANVASIGEYYGFLKPRHFERMKKHGLLIRTDDGRHKDFECWQWHSRAKEVLAKKK